MTEPSNISITDITASQWGLISTAQAARAGISRLKLSRLEKNNELVRVAHGVYRDAGAVASNNEAIKAVWISTNPSLFVDERLRNPDVIIGGTTATYIWDCGDVEPYPNQFYTKTRKQTQRSELVYFRRDYTSDDFSLVDGIPVARIEFAIADLIRREYDQSLIADVLRDARRWLQTDNAKTPFFDAGYLMSLLEPLAKKHGYGSGDDYYEMLLNQIGEGLNDYRKTMNDIMQKVFELYCGDLFTITQSYNDFIQIYIKDALADIVKSMQLAIPKSTLDALADAFKPVIESLALQESLAKNLSFDNERLQSVMQILPNNLPKAQAIQLGQPVDDIEQHKEIQDE
ncbi:MAG: type IV toxin-antitoxin system AbiEi family antitoxin domain-containing protein [Coriobacteriia bacterium]|nr:type IV toxin-antitoxin system AbiEi family antitoxin domain-containing protein [Coriobacteriia bacterium]